MKPHYSLNDTVRVNSLHRRFNSDMEPSAEYCITLTFDRSCLLPTYNYPKGMVALSQC